MHGKPSAFNLHVPLLAVAALALSGCAQDLSSAGPDTALSDQAIACPDGYVAYDFGQRPIMLDSEQAQSVPGAEVPYYTPSGIQISDVQCYLREACSDNGPCQPGNEKTNYLRRGISPFRAHGFYWDFSTEASSLDEADLRAQAEAQCNGNTFCEPTPYGWEVNPSGVGSRFNSYWCEYTYTCEYDRTIVKKTGGPSEDMRSWTGAFEESKYETLRDHVTPKLSCLGDAELGLRARRKERENPVACVPQYCRGKTHRDANMNCVPDEDMGTFALNDLVIRSLSAEGFEQFPINPDTTSVYDKNLQTLHSGSKAPAYFSMRSESQGELPEVRMVYWLTDVYVPSSVDVPQNPDRATLSTIADKNAAVETFRCTAFTVDASEAKAATSKWTQEATGYRVFQHSAQVSPECFGRPEARTEELARRTGLSDPLGSYKYLGTRVNHSIDMVGETLIVEGQGDAAAASTTCAPNPPGFFYDPESESYDLIAYYRQRQVDLTRRTPATNFGGKGGWIEVGEMARAVRVVPQGVHLQTPAIELTNSRFSLTSLPVDVTWELHNADKRHLLNPKNEVCNDSGQCGSPLALKASLYIVPTDNTAGAGMVKLGEIPLSAKEATPEGTTATGEVVIPAKVRSMFFDDRSPLVIPENKETRSYHVLMCVDGQTTELLTRTPKSTSGFHFSNARSLSFELEHEGERYAFGVGTGVHQSVLFAYFAAGNRSPAVPADSACRWSPVPLVVKGLRLTYPVTPIASLGFDGITSDNNSGSSDMSATQDNDSETTCADAAETNCTEASSSGSESSGELARSYYNNDVSLRRVEGKSVSIDGTSELLGMQVLDMADPMDDSTSVAWPSPTDTEVPKLTKTLEPPWDTIAKKLNTATRGTPAEWKVGRYKGRLGLGVGWGYKLPFQIGPIPGMITFTVSAGISVRLRADVLFRPTDKTGYFCTGTEDCIEAVSAAKSFRDAQADCQSRGGRLAELGTSAEADAVLKAAGKSGSYWLGGQQAYRYPKAECASAFNKNECLPKSLASFRWLSSDAEFASATSGGNASYRSPFYGANRSALSGTLPTESGLLFNAATNNVSMADLNSVHPYVCWHRAAHHYSFLQWETQLQLAVGGGVGVSFCVPGPEGDPGICLGGDLNIVTLSLTPTYGHRYYWLRDAGDTVFRRVGQQTFSLPWDLTLLDGVIWAQVNLLLFSVRWDIVTFDGIQIPVGGKLVPDFNQFFDLKK